MSNTAFEFFTPQPIDFDYTLVTGPYAPFSVFSDEEKRLLFGLLTPNCNYLPRNPGELQTRFRQMEEDFDEGPLCSYTIADLSIFDAIFLKYYDVNEHYQLYKLYLAAVCCITRRKPSWVDSLLSDFTPKTRSSRQGPPKGSP